MRQTKKKGLSGVMGLKAAAEYLEVHASTLYRLANGGKVPAVKLGGQWRFKKDLIDDWLTGEMRRNHARSQNARRPGEQEG